jgi:hypothetical protein
MKPRQSWINLRHLILLSNSGHSSFPKTVDGMWDELVASNALATTLLIRVTDKNSRIFWNFMGS